MAAIGTLKWARQTGGRLRPFDRLALARQALQVRAQRRRRARRSYPELAFDEAEVRPPDTPASTRAAAIMERVSAPYLVNHCYRTFAWGRLLAKSHGVRHDGELLFVAALLHDLGLTELHREGRQGEHCFAVIGARRAHEVMGEAGWSAQRLEALEEAITLHLNLVVPASRGAEAHLLHAGAMLDVVGARMEEVRGPCLTGVLDRHPRLEQNENLAAAVARDCLAHPHARPAFFAQRGFVDLIRGAPFLP